MVGRVPEKLEPGVHALGEIVVQLDEVTVPSSRARRGLDEVSLSVRRHEIVGIAGVVGNGQEALAEVLRVSPSRPKERCTAYQDGWRLFPRTGRATGWP